MMERRIPESIKERLRKRLLESMGDEDKGAFIRKDIRDRIRERLREKFQESEVGLRDRLRKRLLEGERSDIRSMLRNRLRRRLFEGREVGVKSMIREKLRRRLLEGRMRGRLLESEVDSIRDRIRDRLRRRLFESRSRLRRSLLENREDNMIGSIGMKDTEGLSERRIAMLEKRNEMLERELRRKTKLLKEAYKVVKRVDEMGGIQKIEKALKLAHDTIVKAGAKLFKEAVDVLSAETGVDKKRVAELVKKVGLKEAREILKKKGSKAGNAPKTIIVESIDDKKEQLPTLATRIAERLSKPLEAGNPGDLKQLGEAVFKKVGE